MFEWDADYRTGIEAIDGEHLVLFSLINQIEINVNNGKGGECVNDVVSALLSYVQFHFQNERGLMEQAGYPRLAEHLREHDLFVERVMAIGAKPDQLARALHLRQFILDWLLAHIMGSDAAFAQFMEVGHVH